MPRTKANRSQGHVYYQNKAGKQHEESNECWCEPAVIEVDKSTLALHNGVKRGKLMSIVIDKSGRRSLT